MSNDYNRRDFLKLSAATVGSIPLVGMASADKATAAGGKSIRLGFVGVGDRGSYHLDCALGVEGVEVPAICDIKDSYLYRAKRWVEESGRPTPRLYGKGETDFKRLCEQEDLDAVICATSWKWHTPVCLAAMNNGKHAVTEVPMVLTVDEAWELVETYEKTGKWGTLALEQALLEGNPNLTLLHMVREGLFGDILHCESGYVHDLRLVKFDPEREPWRLQHSIDRNGDLYPDHPMAKIMPAMDINHGDRFDYLVSMSSKSAMLNKYAASFYGDDHVYAKTKMAQGDYNASLIHTANGSMVTLNFDTNTPHPRGYFRMQGTKGVLWVCRSRDSWIYLDGISPKEHQWEPAEKYFEEYKHPFLKSYKPQARTKLRGHGSGRSVTPLTWYLLIKALREDKMPFFDVYDSVTSSVISPLTEASVSNKSQPVEFPDFTHGKWKTREPIKFV